MVTDDELTHWFVPASCVFFLLFLSTLILRRDGKRKSLPPGPPGFPIIGHLHLMKPPIHRTLHKLIEKYGPIIFLRFETPKVPVVSTPSSVEECFTKNEVVFANSPRTLAGKHLNYDYKSMGFATYGDHWRDLRRLTNQEHFSASRFATSSTARVDEVLLLLKQLFDKSGGRWMQVELRHRFVDLIFDVMLRMISGKRYYGTDVVSQEATEFKNMTDDVFDLLNPSLNGLFPVLQWVDLFGVEKKMKKVMNIGETAMATMRVRAAGTETSASTMEWALANLLNHPEAMQKVKAEIDAYVGKDRFLDESDIPKLTVVGGSNGVQ